MKKEIRNQLLPYHASWIARDKLKDLKQTGVVHNYLKTFSSLLLDIKVMSDEDKIFNFTSGLKPWAQNELL